MISSNDLRPGLTIEFRAGVWQVIEAMHVKPGKGSAFVQTKLRNLETGDVLSTNFRAGERLSVANIEKLKLTFSYRDTGQYILIDSEGKESIELVAKQFGRNLDLLKEGQENIQVMRHRERVVRVDLPQTVDLIISDTPPGEKGNTSATSGKQATLETGARVIVPFHIKVGDTIRIDSRTREYLMRL